VVHRRSGRASHAFGTELVHSSPAAARKPFRAQGCFGLSAAMSRLRAVRCLWSPLPPSQADAHGKSTYTYVHASFERATEKQLNRVRVLALMRTYTSNRAYASRVFRVLSRLSYNSQLP
jgi:hypothetical protein